MVYNTKACQECSLNCLSVHQKQNNASPAVTRFFKIMLGDDCLKVLYLPPSFVRKVRNQIGQGQQSYLEDSTGKQWPVRFSIIDGYLAIQKGWCEFALDHCLEVGELLAFTYIKSCYFVVHIYGISGCERLKFNRRRSRPGKRSREEEMVVRGEPFRTLDINSLGQPGSSTLVASEPDFKHDQGLPEVPIASDCGRDFGKKQFGCTTISMDDPVLMLNKNAGCNQGEDRTYLHDLSSFEMGRNESNPNKIKKTSTGEKIVPDHSQIRKQTQTVDSYVQMATNREDFIGSLCDNVLFGTFLTKSVEKSSMSEGTPCVLSSETNNDGLDNEAQLKIARSKCAVIPKYSGGCSISIPMVKDPSGRQTVAVKKELVEIGQVAFGLPQTSIGKKPNMAIDCAPMPSRGVENINSIVKTEPDMGSALVPYVAASPFLARVKCQSYLELPMSLPPIEGKDGGGDSQGIFLRDSAGRLWPVICYTDTLGIIALVDGWKQFCEKNNIQVGDICEFKSENSIQLIYGVEVIGKLAG